MKIRQPGAVIALAILLCGFAGTAAGSESEGEEAPVTAEPGEHGGHADEPPHELALFLGVTDEKGHGAEGTIGLEYAYALYPRWSVGGLIDYAGGDLRNTVLGIPAFFRPGRGWVLLAAPGVEFHRKQGGETGDHGEVDEDETDFLFRVGVMYKFRIGERFGIFPVLNADFVGGDVTYVYGANFSIEFGK